MASTRISIFPLGGAVIYPGLQLPLHIFEPRYCAMVSDALARDRRIGIIQPQGQIENAPLFEIGCLGRIGEVEALDNDRYNIILEGESRFQILKELDVTTPFRQVEAELIEEPANQQLAAIERAGFEREAQRFAELQGYTVDWETVTRLDDVSLINGVSQIVPFDPASKQALLECSEVSQRCELLIQFFQFFGHQSDFDDDDNGATLQ